MHLFLSLTFTDTQLVLGTAYNSALPPVPQRATWTTNPRHQLRIFKRQTSSIDFSWWFLYARVIFFFLKILDKIQISFSLIKPIHRNTLFFIACLFVCFCFVPRDRQGLNLKSVWQLQNLRDRYGSKLNSFVTVKVWDLFPCAYKNIFPIWIQCELYRIEWPLIFKIQPPVPCNLYLKG